MVLSTALKAQVKKMLSDSQLKALKHTVYSLLYRNNLRKMAVAFGTDKEGSHFYARHYQHHFRHLRRSNIKLLEIGIGGYQDPRTGGNSLRMWKAYFTKGKIFGIDIYDKTYHNEKRIKTFMGSQTDEAFLRNVVAEIGGIDIVIDDGSHYNDHVIKTFKVLFPLLNSTGIYVIEDLQTSYWDEVKGQKWGFAVDEYIPTYFDKNITSIHFYHNLAFIYKGINNETSNMLGKRVP